MKRDLTIAACLDGCADAQREAIACSSGPLLVLAGAGSGKTRVITRKIGYLIAEGTPARDILAITFTNKAAEEMRKRVMELCGEEGGRVWLSTFHAMCARMLRHHAEQAGLKPNFSIFDTADSLKALRQALLELDLSSETTPPATVARVIGKAKASLLGPEDYAASHGDDVGQTIARVYRRYEEFLNRDNAVDFDDLLLKVAWLLDNVPAARERYQERFRHVLIDEYQDTNHAQYVIARSLAARHRNICATGDPDQSIYGWRGADIGNILTFEKDYPDARVVRLEQNYRSTRNILGAANSLIARNVKRREKGLWTDKADGARVRLLVAENERDEARRIARDIRARVAAGGGYGDVAVFYRTNSQSRSLEMQFLEQGISYAIVAGASFFERREIRDLIAYLRLLVNPSDGAALERVINVPPRGLGGRSLERLRDWARNNGRPAREALAHAREAGVGGAQADAAAALDRLLTALAKDVAGPVAPLLQKVIDSIGYVAYARASLDDSDDRLANVGELINSAAEFDSSPPSDDRHESNPPTGLAAFLERTALTSDQDAYDGARGVVSLMTLHAAKGLEFPVCYITGLEEGLLPLMREDDAKNDIEEERRLCFVGLTRARTEAVLTYAAARARFGQTAYTEPSTFIGEMGEEAVERERTAFSRGADEPSRPSRREPRKFRLERRPSFDDDEADRDESPRADTMDNPSDEWGINNGDLVEHPTFGRGRVIGLSGWGSSRTALIRFPMGVKLIALRYRLLKKI